MSRRRGPDAGLNPDNILPGGRRLRSRNDFEPLDETEDPPGADQISRVVPPEFEQFSGDRTLRLTSQEDMDNWSALEDQRVARQRGRRQNQGYLTMPPQPPLPDPYEEDMTIPPEERARDLRDRQRYRMEPFDYHVTEDLEKEVREGGRRVFNSPLHTLRNFTKAKEARQTVARQSQLARSGRHQPGVMSNAMQYLYEDALPSDIYPKFDPHVRELEAATEHAAMSFITLGLRHETTAEQRHWAGIGLETGVKQMLATPVVDNLDGVANQLQAMFHAMSNDSAYPVIRALMAWREDKSGSTALRIFRLQRIAMDINFAPRRWSRRR